mmetsp:Transcript_22517/g.64343  ORF Transcript_22517/g.64343 Transcript_22517/m.64343 type:complete len:99 (-) Transcript_22517:710-1006(-)
MASMSMRGPTRAHTHCTAVWGAHHIAQSPHTHTYGQQLYKALLGGLVTGEGRGVVCGGHVHVTFYLDASIMRCVNMYWLLLHGWMDGWINGTRAVLCR